VWRLVAAPPSCDTREREREWSCLGRSWWLLTSPRWAKCWVTLSARSGNRRGCWVSVSE
jgi:hypothetical protein